MKKYTLQYPPEATPDPLLAQAILETGVLVNILIADVSSNKGMIIVSIEEEDDAKAEKLIKYLENHGVQVERLEGGVVKDDDQCVDCGACYSVCPTNAITLKDYKMVLDNKECIRCWLCLNACPTNALTRNDQ